MKHIFTFVLLLVGCTTLNAQNPGLVISEFYINPPSSDLNLEWVELIATKNIDFSVTPYSVVVNNNGTATASGWIIGGTISYGFQISTGTVTAGQVVYVGGSAMAPTGTKVRIIDVTTTPGDGFGSAQATNGVFGNGGANADGIAVFNVPIASVTNSTVPVDAVFYGTAIGSAFVSTTTGYQLPVNDLYPGGKLQTNSFFTGDPGPQTSKATGTYDVAINSWSGTRNWTIQDFVNDNTSNISLATPPPTPGTGIISTVTQTKAENAGTATVNVTFSSSNALPAKFVVETATYSSAVRNDDYAWSNDTLTIPASTNGVFPFTINILDDAIAERTETILVKIRAVSNAVTTAANYQIIYLTDNDYTAPVGNNELILNNLSSFSNGTEGTNSAEIVAHDPTTNRLYIANSIGAKLDIVDFSNPAVPTLLNSISITPYGNLNSLTVHNGIVAVAVENATPQANGYVVFFDASGNFISQVTVGAMPDMITFNNDFTKVITACEGEPKTDYSVDPEGSIAIIDLTPGIASLTNANVSIANFQAYNGQEAVLRSQGIRIFGPGSSAAQDFEPEYISISDDNTTAYVTLQENNAMAVVNLQTATVTSVRPLGTMNYAAGNSGLDASDQSAGIYIASVPVKGLFMPDALAHATIGGTEYLFSANEGDAREYTAYSEITRLSGANLDATAYPDQSILKNNQYLGRLNITKASGDTDGDGDIDDIHVYGTRSFTIWNAATGALVFDSKDLLEQITATHPATAGFFNASNSSGAAVSKNRSDDKGPEVEGVATAVINGNHYLFASMERVGGVMLFNIDNPAAPTFVGYYNNRTLAANGPDRGAEGIIIIKKENSPNNKDLVILANEVSSTLSIFEINTCVDLAGATITAATDSICTGNNVQLTAAGAANSSYQWFKDNQAVSGQTGTSLTVSQAGNYQLYVSNSTLACADTTISTSITVLPLPVVVADSDLSVCMGTSVTLNASGAQNYNWNNGITSGIAFTPSTTQTYTVTGTNAYGCQNTDQVLVTVNTLPTVSAGSDQAVCNGTSVTLNSSGTATGFTWNNGVSSGVAFTPATTQTYTVTGTDGNGCQNTDQVLVTVNALPIVNAGSDQTVCAGSTVILNPIGAQSYNWNNGVSSGVAFTPAATQTYTVTGTSAAGCQNTDQVLVTVHALPIVNAGSDQSVCAGTSTTVSATGAQNYSWNNGVSSGIAFTPATTQTYTVTGTDVFGCQNTDQLIVTVNALPTVDAGNTVALCSGESFTLEATGATTYVWSNGSANGATLSPSNSAVLTVIGTDANGCSDDAQLVLTVNPLPQVNAGADIEVCNGTIITLNGNGTDNYSWSNGVQNGVSFAAQTSGTFTVTGTDANGCENTDQLVLTVNQNPIVDLGSDSTTCSNYGAIVLNAGSGFTNYDWNTNATTATISAFITGTYEVTVTDVNGCEGTDAVSLVFDPCLGVAENTIDWNIYPNPSSSVVTIETTQADFDVTLRDLNGKILQTETSLTNTLTLDISGLATGAYLVELKQGATTRIERIIKN